MYKIVNYQSNTNQQGFPHGYQLYPAPQDPILIPIHFPPSPQPPLVPPQQQQQEEEDEEEHGNDEEHEHLQPVNQRAQYIINHRQVLATNHGRSIMHIFFLSFYFLFYFFFLFSLFLFFSLPFSLLFSFFFFPPYVFIILF